MKNEPTAQQLLELIRCTREALTVAHDDPQYGARLESRARWVRIVLDALLDDAEDVPSNLRWLRRQLEEESRGVMS